MELRGGQGRLAITKQNIELQQDSLHLTEVRAEAELGNQLDVERQREQERRERLLAAVDASRQATELAMEPYKRGLTDFLSVLDHSAISW